MAGRPFKRSGDFIPQRMGSIALRDRLIVIAKQRSWTDRVKTPRRKPTIYDIATASATSPTTVSMVLNGAWRKHRIKAETAAAILRCAGELGYSVNEKARGLRLSRSGLAGMILPHYRNRFFAGLAESFEAKVRERGLCPVVVSTQRDGATEAKVTETLLAQRIEFLFIAGVRDPQPLNALCRAAGVRCVNVDLPGEDAPSVVSDNRGGAQALTERLIEKLEARGGVLDDWLFFGGVQDDNSTRERIEGFCAALAGHGVAARPGWFQCLGYSPATAVRTLSARYGELGRLPAALFVNGVPALEGALDFTATLRPEEKARVVVGAFDWDPFAAHASLDLTMVRQDVEGMIEASFQLLDDFKEGRNPRIVVQTALR